MRFGSTSTNINGLTVFTAVSALLGLLNLEMFTVNNIVLSVISFYVLNILGIWMTLHRYYSHNSFQFKNSNLKWFFTLIALLAGRGSPLGWVYLHRKHHAYSDTEKDPHSPKYTGYKLFGFQHYKKQESEKMNLFLVKDIMSPEQLFIHKWYMIILLPIILFLSLISIELLYFIWIVPAFLIQLSQYNFNYFGHMYGYRNFATKDDSRNNILLFPFILGEAWHNNHHANSNRNSTKIKKHEYDPVAVIIKLISK
jgi:stearoyl-CoA desaturase (delta-9 desaturase)